MTELLDQALKSALGLSPDTQVSIPQMTLKLCGLVDETSPVVLAPAEEEAIAASKAAAARGEFATDEQVRNSWAKHGP